MLKHWFSSAKKTHLFKTEECQAQYSRKYSNLFQSEVWEEVHLKDNVLYKGKYNLTSTNLRKVYYIVVYNCRAFYYVHKYKHVLVVYFAWNKFI